MTDQNVLTQDSTEELTYCAVHPNKETSLRCITCDRLMCVDCVVRTPVGYRCKQCARQQDDKFFNATAADYLIIAAIIAVLSGIAAALLGRIGMIFILLIIGFPLGGVISEAALRATKRRRGRYSPLIGVVAAIVGGVLGNAISVHLNYLNYIQQIAEEAGVPVDTLPSISFMESLTASFNDIGSLLLIGLIAFAVYSRYKLTK